jgi:hypothetical protein
LPPGDTVRWSPHRKAKVVNGVRNGALSLDEACQRYQLSADEFLLGSGLSTVMVSGH